MVNYIIYVIMNTNSNSVTQSRQSSPLINSHRDHSRGSSGRSCTGFAGDDLETKSINTIHCAQIYFSDSQGPEESTSSQLGTKKMKNHQQTNLFLEKKIKQ